MGNDPAHYVGRGLSPSTFPWTRPAMRVNCMVTDIEDAVPINSDGAELLAWGEATLKKPNSTGSRAGHRPTDGPHRFYSCSLRAFLRLRLRASASFTRFFSPGFR